MRLVINFFDRMVQRYLPDAFLFAVLLTIIVYMGGVIVTNNSAVDMLAYWGDGFWDLLTFTMQMALIVVTGYVLANTPFVKNILVKLSNVAKSPGQAVMLVSFITAVASLINYGFGLVVGALLSIQLVQRIPTVEYRVLVASAYSGFIVWHGGLSASIPLLIATDDHFLVETMGTIPVVNTLFGSANLFIVIVLLVTLPLINWVILKSRDDRNLIHESLSYDEYEVEKEVDESNETPSDRLENSAILSMVIGLLGLLYVVYYFYTNGFDLNINIVNFIMLMLGILFHRTPRRFLHSVNKAVKNIGGIIVQFPFYAGIMGMMEGSGLSEQMSLWFIHISNEFTFPLFTFLSAGIVNFFVPSGGGQWAVQGPIMVEAGMQIGVDHAKTAIAVAWGDAWTNLIQPFWALPLLAIAGLKVRDIMGFLVIILVYTFFPIAIGLLFL